MQCMEYFIIQLTVEWIKVGTSLPDHQITIRCSWFMGCGLLHINGPSSPRIVQDSSYLWFAFMNTTILLIHKWVKASDLRFQATEMMTMS